MDREEGTRSVLLREAMRQQRRFPFYDLDPDVQRNQPFRQRPQGAELHEVLPRDDDELRARRARESGQSRYIGRSK